MKQATIAALGRRRSDQEIAAYALVVAGKNRGRAGARRLLNRAAYHLHFAEGGVKGPRRPKSKKAMIVPGYRGKRGLYASPGNYLVRKTVKGMAGSSRVRQARDGSLSTVAAQLEAAADRLVKGMMRA